MALYRTGRLARICAFLESGYIPDLLKSGIVLTLTKFDLRELVLNGVT